VAQYSRAKLKQIIRQRCDLENTVFESELELENHINDSAAVLHDLLISAAETSYAVERASFATTAGSSTYTIAASNFYRLVRIGWTIDDLEYPLSSYEEADIIFQSSSSNSWGPGCLPRYELSLSSDSVWRVRFDPPPDTVTTISLVYHTAPPEYTDDSDTVSIPFADYLVVEACIRIKDKEDRDTTRLERERAMIQKRIEDWGATFDRANPHRTIEAPQPWRTTNWRSGRLF
jgi:hypothetical protein